MKNKTVAMLLAYFIGIIIFIDGLLSIMFTAVVTRPLIDRFKVSMRKLAFICDATFSSNQCDYSAQFLGSNAYGSYWCGNL